MLCDQHLSAGDILRVKSNLSEWKGLAGHFHSAPGMPRSQHTLSPLQEPDCYKLTAGGRQGDLTGLGFHCSVLCSCQEQSPQSVSGEQQGPEQWLGTAVGSRGKCWEEMRDLGT